MKRLTILIFFLSFTGTSFAQMTSLSENMNTTCITGANGPVGWLTFNPISTPAPEGKWKCDPTFGRSGSPGVSCSGYYGSPGTFHLDTSVLVSPGLDLSHYTTIYVNFDTKTTNINLGAKLELLVSADSTMNTDTAVSDSSSVYNKTTSLMPLFGSDDESDWVTHQADLTPYKHIVPLFLGFRYISASGTVGSRWYLDNVMTTTVPNSLADIRSSKQTSITGRIQNGDLQLFVSGASQNESADVILSDLGGRILLKTQLTLSANKSCYTINNVNVATGIYVLRVSQERNIVVTRVTAQ